MPSARLTSQPKTLETLPECTEENSLRNGKVRSSGSQQGSVLDLKDESQEEMSTDLSSRSTEPKGGQFGASLNPNHHLHHNHNHNHHHLHRQHHQLHHKQLSHRAGSSASAKLVTQSHSKSTEPLYKLKHHQPHCQHYSQHQKKQYQLHQHHSHQHHQHHQRPASRLQQHHSRLQRASSDLSNDIAAKSFRCKAGRLISKQKDAPYLLVEQMPAAAADPYQAEFSFHRAGSSGNRYNNNNGNGGQPRHSREPAVCKENLKRATVKFISQLYFLLHLSAILSLLLHHKSLTGTLVDERKPADTGSQPIAASHHSPALVRSKKLATFVNRSVESTSASESLHHSALLLPNSLPQPLSQTSSSQPLPPAAGSTTESNRLSRQVHHSDFLVRLLGLWQARLALHNFLCYLLLTSIAILVSMRLARLCLKPTLVSSLGPYHHHHHHHDSPGFVSANFTSTDQLKLRLEHQPLPEYGSLFRRTRLDCTPVLVGSISLGVIQLIVIGLDFANNLHTDWLSKGRWPTAYLPFFQFVFVALLMQYILGKVAKNHEQTKPLLSTIDDKNKSNNNNNPRILSQPTISFERRRRRRFTWTSGSHSTTPTTTTTTTSGFNLCDRSSPVGHGFKNIALAHLLVTHILLWLLRLNSISLFRTIADETTAAAGQLQPKASGTKHARHYNLSSLHPSIVSDASLNLEANLRKATETHLHAIEAPSLFSTPNGANNSSLANVDPLKALKPASNQQHQISNKRSREAVYAYNKPLEPHPISDHSIGLHHFKLIPAHPGSLEPSLNAEATLSKSQQQLMELINLASKTRPGPLDFNSTSSLEMLNSFHLQTSTPAPLPPPSPPPAVVTYTRATTMAPPTHPPRAQTMPKRPTVFRQNPSPLLVTNLSSQHRFATGTHQQQGPPRSITPTVTEAGSEQKQRVRVLLSRVENPTLDSNYKRFSRPQLKRLQSSPPEGRPFPSVESDLLSGPTSSTRTPLPPSASARPDHASMTTTTTTTTTTTSTTTTTTARPLTSTVVEVERDEAGNNSTAEEEPEEEEAEEEGTDNGVTEGPTPNGGQRLNDTTAGHLYNRDRDRDRDRTLNAMANDARLVTDEEALLAHFGESTRLDTFSAPAALTSVMEPNDERASIMSQFGEGASIFERRFLEQDSHSEPATDGLSFADYLLPIVQQYHILIIAILFNMWIDGLHTREHGAHKRTEDYSSSQQTSGTALMRPSDRRFLLGQPNLLSSGSDKSPRGRSDFLAVPVKQRSNGLRPPGLESVSKLDFGSPNGAAFRGSSTRWQAYAIRKHLSQSMDSLRHPRESANQEDESSSSLSRHNSLRSSSSEQLLSTSGRDKIHHQAGSRSPLLNLASQHHHHQQQQQLLLLQQRQQVAAFPLVVPDKGLELSACSLFFGLITVCITLMVLIANQNYLSALAQCTILLASVLLCMVGLCLSNLSLPGELGRYKSEPKHVQSLHLIFILAGYYSGLTLLLNLDKRQTPGQPLPVVLLQFVHRHLMPISSQANQLFMFQLLLALKGLLLVLQVTLQTVLNRASLNRSMGHLRQVYTSLMFANLGLWALELRDEQQFLSQHHHHHASSPNYSELGGGKELASSSSMPSLGLMNELSGTLVSLSHFYHALLFLQR